MTVNDQLVAVVRMILGVSVDATDAALLDRISESNGSLSIDDVVRDEIESNLESVSYVRQVSIIMKPKGGAK
jgi:hypothetical protein